MSWTVTTISLTVRLIKDLCGSTSGREEHEAAVTVLKSCITEERVITAEQAYREICVKKEKM